MVKSRLEPSVLQYCSQQTVLPCGAVGGEGGRQHFPFTLLLVVGGGARKMCPRHPCPIEHSKRDLHSISECLDSYRRYWCQCAMSLWDIIKCVCLIYYIYRLSFHCNTSQVVNSTILDTDRYLLEFWTILGNSLLAGIKKNLLLSRCIQ